MDKIKLHFNGEVVVRNKYKAAKYKPQDILEVWEAGENAGLNACFFNPQNGDLFYGADLYMGDRATLETYLYDIKGEVVGLTKPGKYYIPGYERISALVAIRDFIEEKNTNTFG